MYRYLPALYCVYILLPLHPAAFQRPGQATGGGVDVALPKARRSSKILQALPPGTKGPLGDDGMKHGEHGWDDGCLMDG